MHTSPLRYPGGKTFLNAEFQRILSAIGLDRPIYVEPYAGGAGAALSLLYADKVERVVINDRDRAIHAFWKAVTEDTDAFVDKILSVPLTILEWERQRKIYRNENANFLNRGFATFFLNRTNVSGVMNAWPIGGLNQEGAYKIDARFNRKNLAERVQKIGEFSDRIDVRNDDGIALTKSCLGQANTFVYLDPPYFKKGACLYMNHYHSNDHSNLAQILNENAEKTHWLLTYDDERTISKLYADRAKRRISLSYRVNTVRKAKELMICSEPIRPFLGSSRQQIAR